ncbi:MAG: hypothetical protein Q8P82_01100 [bacterium]|nr:hypothetical protein [bacterium]
MAVQISPGAKKKHPDASGCFFVFVCYTDDDIMSTVPESRQAIIVRAWQKFKAKMFELKHRQRDVLIGFDRRIADRKRAEILKEIQEGNKE